MKTNNNSLRSQSITMMMKLTEDIQISLQTSFSKASTIAVITTA
jgi:hypothetical protein